MVIFLALKSRLYPKKCHPLAREVVDENYTVADAPGELKNASSKSLGIKGLRNDQ